MMLATVVVSSPVLQGTRSEFTDDTGSFVIDSLPPGDHSLLVVYGDAKVRVDVEVRAGQRASVDAMLPADGCRTVIIVSHGAQWILEGVKGDAYHVAARQGPTDKYYAKGMLFRRAALWLLERAPLEIPENELY
jgi:hypothetical protein